MAEQRELLERYIPEDWHRMELGVDAEAAADAALALELHLAVPHVEGSMREHVLREVVLLGDEAPPWLYSRWILRQAHRWMLLRDRDELHGALVDTIALVYPDFDLEEPLHDDPGTFLSQVLTADWMCAQLALFEYGGLAAFLREQADPLLIERADQIDAWTAAPMGGYRLSRLLDDRLLVVDLATGGQLEVLNLGAAWGCDCGSSVIGRLVPISAAPGLMFESRPVAVEEQTARLVGRAATERTSWTNVVSGARDAGRLPTSFSVVQPTSLLSDVPGGAPTGLTRGDIADPARRAALRRAGLSERAEAAVRLGDFLLDRIAEDRSTAAGLAPLGVSLLLEPELRYAVTEHCVDPSREEAWIALAAAVQPPFRERCRELASLAGGRRPAA